MRKVLSSLFLLSLSLSVFAGKPYSTGETSIGTLLNDPQAKAILEKYLPETISNPQFTMAHGFTLVFIQGFDQTGELTDENLARIETELAALPSEESGKE